MTYTMYNLDTFAASLEPISLGAHADDRSAQTEAYMQALARGIAKYRIEFFRDGDGCRGNIDNE